MATRNDKQRLGPSGKLEEVMRSYGWTEAEFAQMDRKTLSKFATWNGWQACSLTGETLERAKARGFGYADAQLAYRVLVSSVAKSTAHIKPESFTNTNGGTNHYLPEIVEQRTLAGKTKVRANSPIPAGFEETEKHDNVVALASLCSQLVQVEAGMWKNRVNQRAWSAVFGVGSGINVDAVMKVAEMIVHYLSSDAVWQTMPMTSRNSITGIEAMNFVRQALDRLSDTDYDILNTYLVMDLFAAYELREDGWYRIGTDSGPLVPDSLFEIRPATQETAEALEHVAPEVFWYRGGWAPSPMMPECTYDMKTTERCVKRADEIRGSKDSTTSILAHMRDFSGLTDTFGKRIQFTLAATLYCWTLGLSVDIQLTTVGDIPMLASSLGWWKNEIKTKAFPEFQIPGTKTKDVYPCDYKFILGSITDNGKYDARYSEYVTERRRQSSVVVFYNPGSLPNSTSKDVKVDYDFLSMKILPDAIRAGPYIAYVPVYGVTPFPEDKTVQTEVKSSLSRAKFWDEAVYTYGFSNSSDWNGVLSTIDGLHLCGWGFERVEKQWDMSVEKIQLIKLTKFTTRKAWFARVKTDAEVMMLTFLRPVSRYSPISNLPKMSKSASEVVQATVYGDEGKIVANHVRSAKASVAKKVTSSLSNRASQVKLPSSSAVPIKPVMRVNSPSLTTPQANIVMQQKPVVSTLRRQTVAEVVIPEDDDSGENSGDENDGDDNEQQGGVDEYGYDNEDAPPVPVADDH